MEGRSAQTGVSFLMQKKENLTCKSSDHRPALRLCKGEDSRGLRVAPESPSPHLPAPTLQGPREEQGHVRIAGTSGSGSWLVNAGTQHCPPGSRLLEKEEAKGSRGRGRQRPGPGSVLWRVLGCAEEAEVPLTGLAPPRTWVALRHQGQEAGLGGSHLRGAQNGCLLLPKADTRWRHGQGRGCRAPPCGKLCRGDPAGAHSSHPVPAASSVLAQGLPWALRHEEAQLR